MPGRLELEDTGRLTRREELERLGVVEGDAVEIDLDLPLGPDGVDGLTQDRQVGQAEEVELEQAERLDRVHLVLGHERFRVRRLLERHDLGQGLTADDHAGGVGRGIPGDALELAGKVDKPPHLWVGVDHLAQGRGDLEGLLELDAELVGHGLGDPVDLAVAEPEHPADISDRRPGEHRPEGDDLGDVVWTVFAGDVGDDLVTSAVFEVDVDVGHRHPVGVEEALERQAVADRVDRRDAEGVGDDRPGSGTTAGRLDARLPGEPHEVGDDEEVGRVAHRRDDAELVVEAPLEGRGNGPVAGGQATLAFLGEPCLGRLAIGHREVRDPVLPERQLDMAHLGDPASVPDRVGLVGEEGGHLGRALEVEVVGLEPHPSGCVDVAARTDAQQDVVGVGLRLVDVMEVVRHDQGQPDLRSEPEQLLVQPPLLGQPVVLQLQEEAIRPEDVRVLTGQPTSALPVVDLEGPGDLAVEAGR